MSYCPACQGDFPESYSRCPHDGTTLLSGRTVGKYQITDRIGEGGMGAVYKAINPDTRAEVAVKLLHARAAANSSIRARFQREAEAVAALRTRHVIRIFDFGNDNDTLYLVMELLDGENLRDRLRKSGAMPLGRAAQILEGALRGLGAAHRAGVTHRDLKPENIFLANTDDGEVIKVLDFGIARVADTTLTDTGALIGTPAYMAPEQVASSFGKVGPRTDVFAMGVIAYEMLTGISPFLDGEDGTSSVNEILGRVVEGTFEPLATLRPDLPPAVVHLVERALLDAADRFADADTMRQALVASVSGVADLSPGSESGGHAISSGGARAHSGATATQRTDLAGESTIAATIAAPSRRGRRLWMAAAAVGVVVAGIATLVALRDRDEPDKPDKPAPRAAVDTPGPSAGRSIDAAPPPPPAPPSGMVRIDGGTMSMGSTFYPRFREALPPRDTDVASFWIDVDEAHGDDDMPLANLSHEQAAQHCAELGKRLPTEAEWEYAARRGELANGRLRGKTKLRGPSKVGSHAGDTTRDGVHDMLGNLTEWTATPWVAGDGTADPEQRTLRGASFTVKAGSGFNSTIHVRFPAPRDKGDADIGFRCATDDPPPQGVK